MSRHGRPLTPAEAQRLQAQARGETPGKVPKANKFHAEAVTVDGLRFGSRAEAKRAAELQWQEKAGLITDLVLDKRNLRFDFVVNGEWIGSFTADAMYHEQGALVVEDTKSKATRKTPWFARVKRLMWACHGIKILEIVR